MAASAPALDRQLTVCLSPPLMGQVVVDRRSWKESACHGKRIIIIISWFMWRKNVKPLQMFRIAFGPVYFVFASMNVVCGAAK